MLVMAGNYYKGNFMFIELTNASEGFEGRPIAIDSSIITSVYEANVASSEEKAKYGTFIFSHSTSQNWRVKEKVSKVVELLNAK